MNTKKCYINKMENLCDKCKQEECPRCKQEEYEEEYEESCERYKEWLNWIRFISIGYALYGIGKIIGRVEKGIEVQRDLKVLGEMKENIDKLSQSS